MDLLAHSAKCDKGIPAQSYAEHILKARQQAFEKAQRAGSLAPDMKESLSQVVVLATEFHDMGKLDDENQAVLSGQMKSKKLPVNHVDSGVAYLRQLAKNNLSAMLALEAVYAHHIGLQSRAKEFAKGTKMYRDENLIEYTAEHLSAYLERHRTVIDEWQNPSKPPSPKLDQQALFLRFALSCLADADHGDTARHYGEPQVSQSYGLKAVDRLAALDSYVAGLAKNMQNDLRTQLRNSVYIACKKASPEPSLYACDSPVGTGKTTAVMAHLLNAAQAKGLQRIFVVLPFTNIIDQSVDTYRKSLVLDDEDPEHIIAAHHHKADFSKLESRQYTYLWQAPIVVTTAVQFFETLASNQPATLRKLHQLAGSAVFIDEAHAALPSHLWPQAWQWLKQLSNDWGCHIVLASGSLTRFWELVDFVKPTVKLPELINEEIRQQCLALEQARVKPETRKEALNLAELAEWVVGEKGPRLLILNTVQSAAVTARYIAEHYGNAKVEHLSTALTPLDRHKTLEKVKARLKDTQDNDWVLVATSCVEAGVDLSFKTGFRERCSLVSLLQTAGRINRENLEIEAAVWDFSLKFENGLKKHPVFDDSARILGELFDSDEVSPKFCCEALKREIRQSTPNGKVKQLEKAEKNLDFPEVEQLFKVISSYTITVLVDDEVISRLKNWQPVGRDEIQKNSVQIWTYKQEDWGISEIPNRPGLFYGLDYDDFIGYMKGGLASENAKNGAPLQI
ncbi:CRISPR-associated endonuclease Cas3'' [Methylomicrobium lacus]|uniref:CRISPR-associated endonuclease Cas3'' n=1 Tax=Methylomicrobium lacus TaxID=136992 RepID=UPI0035A954E8